MSLIAATTTLNPLLSNDSGADSSGDDDDGNGISMERLYPALIQCFAIIICGWVLLWNCGSTFDLDQTLKSLWLNINQP